MVKHQHWIDDGENYREQQTHFLPSFLPTRIVGKVFSLLSKFIGKQWKSEKNFTSFTQQRCWRSPNSKLILHFGGQTKQHQVDRLPIASSSTTHFGRRTVKNDRFCSTGKIWFFIIGGVLYDEGILLLTFWNGLWGKFIHQSVLRLKMLSNFLGGRS